MKGNKVIGGRIRRKKQFLKYADLKIIQTLQIIPLFVCSCMYVYKEGTISSSFQKDYWIYVVSNQI